MTANDFFAQTVADAVKEAIAPLVARIDTLERLLTATGGERAADMLTREQVAARSSLYPDDTVYIKPDHKRSYSGFMYEKLTVTWKFSNMGTQTWRGRKLYLSNHDEIRPRAESNYIEIPETPPKTGVEISTVIELRPFEGRTTCHWIMVDSDDNDCYPGSRMFDIDIDVKFNRHKKPLTFGASGKRLGGLCFDYTTSQHN